MKKLLFLLLMLLGTLGIDIVFGEIARRENLTTLQSKNTKKEQHHAHKQLKKKRKGHNVFAKIKRLFTIKKRNVNTQKYLIWAVVGAIALLIGGIFQIYSLYVMGVFFGFFGFLIGLLILITGNGDWNTTMGFILALASIVIPYILLVRSFD